MATDFEAIRRQFAYPTFIHRTGIQKRIGGFAMLIGALTAAMIPLHLVEIGYASLQ